MSDPVTGNGAVDKTNEKELVPVTDLHGDINTRDQLLAKLRSSLSWVSVQDHSIAVDIDSVVHQLEAMAEGNMREQLDKVTAERDAAYADLWRIYKITHNPMVAYSERIKQMAQTVTLGERLGTEPSGPSNV